MPDTTLWTKFNNRGFAAERAINDATGRDIATAIDSIPTVSKSGSTVTITTNGTSVTADENVIETVQANGTALTVSSKTVNIPLASFDTTASPATYADGLMTGQEKEKLSGLPSTQLTLAGDGTYITATESSGTVTVALVATTGSYTMIQ